MRTTSEAACTLGIFSNGQKIITFSPVDEYWTEWSLISIVHLWSHKKSVNGGVQKGSTYPCPVSVQVAGNL